jgi:hypothetical protein
LYTVHGIAYGIAYRRALCPYGIAYRRGICHYGICSYGNYLSELDVVIPTVAQQRPRLPGYVLVRSHGESSRLFEKPTQSRISPSIL